MIFPIILDISFFYHIFVGMKLVNKEIEKIDYASIVIIDSKYTWLGHDYIQCALDGRLVSSVPVAIRLWPANFKLCKSI